MAPLFALPNLCTPGDSISRNAAAWESIYRDEVVTMPTFCLNSRASCVMNVGFCDGTSFNDIFITRLEGLRDKMGKRLLRRFVRFEIFDSATRDRLIIDGSLDGVFVFGLYSRARTVVNWNSSLNLNLDLDLELNSKLRLCIKCLPGYDPAFRVDSRAIPLMDVAQVRPGHVDVLLHALKACVRRPTHREVTLCGDVELNPGPSYADVTREETTAERIHRVTQPLMRSVHHPGEAVTVQPDEAPVITLIGPPSILHQYGEAVPELREALARGEAVDLRNVRTGVVAVVFPALGDADKIVSEFNEKLIKERAYGLADADLGKGDRKEDAHLLLKPAYGRPATVGERPLAVAESLRTPAWPAVIATRLRGKAESWLMVTAEGLRLAVRPSGGEETIRELAQRLRREDIVVDRAGRPPTRFMLKADATGDLARDVRAMGAAKKAVDPKNELRWGAIGYTPALVCVAEAPPQFRAGTTTVRVGSHEFTLRRVLTNTEVLGEGAMETRPVGRPPQPSRAAPSRPTSLPTTAMPTQRKTSKPAPFFAIRVGRETGVKQLHYEDVRRLVEGHPGAVYKSFKTRAQAEAFMEQAAPPARKRARPSAGGASDEQPAGAMPASAAAAAASEHPVEATESEGDERGGAAIDQ